jgi:hypothetical protein
MVSILFGLYSIPFSIHRSVLSRSAVLVSEVDALSRAKQKLSILQFEETTAHTLVHYLYTGRYQDMQSLSHETNLAAASYQEGTYVYCAAVRYRLPGLAELAKEKIRVLDESVSIAEVLVIARDYAFPLLPDDEAWYPAYLEDAIRHAMIQDPEPFRRPEFITQVEGNRRLLHVVWKTVVSNYASLPLLNKEHSDIVALAPEAVADDVDGAHIEERLESDEIPSSEAPTQLKREASATDALPPYQMEPEPSASDNVFENPLKLDDIEPTLDTPQAPEPFTDERGFEKSKTYQKMGKKDIETSVRSSEDGKREDIAHKRSDSVVQVEEAVTTPLEIVEDADKSGDVALSEANSLIEADPAPKRWKKGKKKKSQIVF